MATERNQRSAKGNIKLGWCPCGEELESECECGVSRLAYVQGKALPVTRLTVHPRLRSDDPEGGSDHVE